MMERARSAGYRQYQMLSLASPSAYYRVQEFNEADLVLMHRIDALASGASICR